MRITYAPRKKTTQKVAGSKVASVRDASSQSESLQRKANMVNNAAQRIEAPRPNNTGMPDNLKSGIESLSGFSMDDVRVHYNSSKPATVQALAYTQGTDIHVAPGQEKHLPHEAWHVAQQIAGRVSPTTNINGMPVNDNAALEHEADVMGEKASYDNFLVAEAHTSPESHNTIQNFSSHKAKDNNKKVLQRVRIFVNETPWEKKADEPFDSTKEENSKTDESFDSIITNALFEIQNQFVIEEICKADYIDTNGKIQPNSNYDLKGNHKDRCSENWNDIIITEGNQCAFEGGGQKNNKLLLLMNIEQCKKSIFGNYKDFLKSDKIVDTTDKESDKIVDTTDEESDKIVDTTDEEKKIAPILLHELGHAYQHYLSITNKKLPLKSDIDSLRIYPIFFNTLYNIEDTENINRMHNALHHYNVVAPEKINIEDIMNGLKTHNPDKIEIVKKIICNIGKGAHYSDLDGDNIFMNEIPYNNEKKLGTRTYYGGMTTIGIVKFVKDLVNLSDSFEDKINKLEFDISKSYFDNIWEIHQGTILEIIKNNLMVITEKTKDSDIFLSEMYFDLWDNYLKFVAADNNISIDILKMILEKAPDEVFEDNIGPIKKKVLSLEGTNPTEPPSVV